MLICIRKQKESPVAPRWVHFLMFTYRNLACATSVRLLDHDLCSYLSKQPKPFACQQHIKCFWGIFSTLLGSNFPSHCYGGKFSMITLRQILGQPGSRSSFISLLKPFEYLVEFLNCSWLVRRLVTARPSRRD